MKHVLFPFVMGIMLVVAGCTTEKGIATDDDMEVVKEDVVLEVEEDEQETEEASSKYQIELGGETFTLNLKKHPILNNFVSTSSDPGAKLSAMNFIPITMNEHADKALIEFACYEGRCSYIVIDFTKEQSILLVDLAKLEQVQVSHDNLMAMKFARKNQEGITTHHVEILDLKDFEQKILSIGTEDNSELRYEPYRFPVENMKWSESGDLMIDIPKIEDYTSYNLENWKSKGAPTIEINLTIN